MKNSHLPVAARATRFCSIERLESRISPATFTVTNTLITTAAGSLLSALNSANATPNVGGPDVIVFNIPGPGPFVIAPGSVYTITEAVIIDGFTQPGSSPNTLAAGDNAVMQIVINGASAGAAANGLRFTSTADGSTVRGLVMNGYASGGSALFFDSGSDNNVVEGCFIGTNATGTAASANSTGITVVGANNLIGGLTPAARNVISGNSAYGINLGNNFGILTNTVQGNFIGLDASGTNKTPNTVYGIYVFAATGQIIGGTSAAARNIISGNGSDGIHLVFNSDTIIQGNYIGTDVTGTLARGNGGDGIRSDSNGATTLIGGTSPGAGNVISGNAFSGVRLLSSFNTVAGNLIGTDATGMVKLGNFLGVSIMSASSNLIGGTDAGARNLISGNMSSGIELGGGTADASFNRILGNYIGADINGAAVLGNGGTGIVFFDSAFSANFNTIGGTQAGAANLIVANGNAFSSTGGVTIFSGTGNIVRGNSITGNVGLGIDLKTSGVTANDPGDTDAGVNGLQNFPVLFSAGANAAGTMISGVINSNANTLLVIDFYANDDDDAFGFSEGAQYLGALQLVTDSIGNAFFSTTLAAVIAAGRTITATATTLTQAPYGNTSEFSQPIAVTATPHLSIGNATVNEGISGTTDAAFTVTLSAASTQAVTVKFATAGASAASDVDFVAQSGTLTFAPGVTTQTIHIALLGDTLDEFAEVFAVNLSDATNAEIAGGQGIGTITDDDAAPAFSVSNAALREGDAGEASAVFTVTLSEASGKETRVDYSTAGDSAGAGDFRSASGTLIFAPGETSKLITVPVFGDRIVEADEAFALNLNGAINASLGDGTGAGVIENDDQAGSGGIAFNAATSYDVGTGPVSVATGDVNGDLRPDLVTADGKAGTVSVRFGNADGTFADAATYLTGGKMPNRVVLGDFDGFNGLDIAVSNGGSKNIGLLLNNGSGVFGGATLLAAGTKPAALHTGDLNGDGDLDFVVTNAANKICVLLGNGDGTFAAGVKFASGGTAPVDIGIGDFNGDTHADIAIVNAGTHNVKLLLGNAAGAFAPSARAFNVGLGATALAVGDLNGDGIDDIAVSHAVTRFVSVLLGRSGAPGAELRSQLKIGYPGVHAPRSIAIGDLDADGIADLVLANAAAGSFSGLLGLGNGTFRTPQEFAIDSDPKSTPSSLALDDFNGDGLLDVAVAQLGANAVAVALRS